MSTDERFRPDDPSLGKPMTDAEWRPFADALNIEPMTEERFRSRCTCADADGRHWCLLHDPAWPDTVDELLDAMQEADG